MLLKKNWPVVHADVGRLFKDRPEDMVFETHEKVELTGGRIEIRRQTAAVRSTR